MPPAGLLSFVVGAALCTSSLQAQATKPGRRALVIGNGRYANLPVLSTAWNDAKALGAALTETGFAVNLAHDVDGRALTAEIEAFRSSLKPGDTAVFYFSGYGVQLDNENYLLPTNIDPKNADALYNGTYSVRRLQTVLQKQQAGLKILILDACYSAPAFSDLAARGLATPVVEDPETDIVLPVLPGRTIADSPGQANSLFAKELVGTLKRAGLSPEQLFDETRRSVLTASKGQQAPQQFLNVLRPFYFRDPLPVIAKTVVTAPVNTDFTNPKDGLIFARIPAGVFQMGCVPADNACAPDESPHQVTLSHDFWISTTEVPVSAYRHYAGAGLAAMPSLEMFDKKTQKRLKSNVTESEDAPIINVGWTQAEGYCEWAGGRLPTEAEWEYAARGGAASKIFPWGNELTHNNANFLGAEGYDIWQLNAPVSSFPKNGYGLFNMAGNVWEWVADFYDPQFYTSSGAAKDPKGPAGGAEKGARGGSHTSEPLTLRASNRGHFSPVTARKDLGFRCLIDKPKP